MRVIVFAIAFVAGLAATGVSSTYAAENNPNTVETIVNEGSAVTQTVVTEGANVAQTAIQETSEVAQTAITEGAGVANVLIDKVSGGLQQLGQAISGAAPYAWKLVVMGNWASAMVVIVGGMLLWTAAGVTGYTSYRAACTGYEIKNRDGYGGDAGDGWFVGTWVLGAVSVVFFFIGLIMIVDNLAMGFAPEAMTARDLLLRAIEAAS